MSTRKDCHTHVCTDCGATWRVRTRIVVRPVMGDLKGHEITIDPAELPIIGYGQKLRRFVDAVWVRKVEALLHDGSIFGVCGDFGLVEVRARNLKDLEERLGDDFVRVEQGILVSLGVSLVLNSRERMCGIAESVVDGHATIQWVRGSRRCMNRLRQRLLGKPKSAPVRRPIRPNSIASQPATRKTRDSVPSRA